MVCSSNMILPKLLNFLLPKLCWILSYVIKLINMLFYQGILQGNIWRVIILNIVWWLTSDNHYYNSFSSLLTFAYTIMIVENGAQIWCIYISINLRMCRRCKTNSAYHDLSVGLGNLDAFIGRFSRPFLDYFQVKFRLFLDAF
jgi:hypothetical protein